MAWPICWLNMALPIWFNMPSIGPAMARASAGIASPMAATTLSATGSTSWRHAGIPASTHSARLQAATVLDAAGNSVTPSSQCSASLPASCTFARSPASGERSVFWATIWRARSRARSQFTAPS